MLTYIIKRLFLMIPTFLAISLIVFTIVNFAPGNPGAKQAGAEGGQQANTGEQRESYRIFKEQFNLDKPVLLNTRYGLTSEEVSNVMTNILNEDGSVSPALRIEAQETMENWGRYAVPALIDILNTSDNIAKRALASQRLTINARKRMAGEFRKDLTAEQKAGNKVIAAEIESFKGKYFMAGESEDSKAITEEESQAFWNRWYDANKDDFAYGGAKKSVSSS